ncbi:response regulator [Burkholderia singularis]|uniref:response regulator n=2 Tax=Burkholderia TaxID=32008 RepID=UPI001E357A77|nr:response regulator [Burkholderia sp. Bp7605]
MLRGWPRPCWLVGASAFTRCCGIDPLVRRAANRGRRRGSGVSVRGKGARSCRRSSRCSIICFQKEGSCAESPPDDDMGLVLFTFFGPAMSRFAKQPVFYPVSVVFLDDNPDFLDALRGILRNEHLHHFFNAPDEALNFMLKHGRRATPQRLSGAEYSEFEKKGLNAFGQDPLTDAARFDEVAAIVVDYQMGEINGVEFLASLGDVACAKILLTSVASEREAVDAFNDGLIDLYLKKSAPDMTRKLTAALADAKVRHCAERGHIGVHGIGSAYCDARAIAAMRTIVERERIVEYYWRPEQNVVLMFDAHGQPSVFLAWDDDEWAFQCDVLTDEGGDADMRREMEARRVMPLFWPFQAYRSGMMSIRSTLPIAIPGWDGAFYGWSPVDAPVLDVDTWTFARWRAAHAGQRR